MVKFHRVESAPGACAAGLFIQGLNILLFKLLVAVAPVNIGNNSLELVVEPKKKDFYSSLCLV